MADLVTTISESVTLNGALRGSTNSVTITGITDAFERIVTCPHSATTTVATFSTNVYDSAGAIDTQNVRYVRVTNLSDSIDLEVGVGGAASSYTTLLKPGTSHILARTDDSLLAVASATPTYGSLADVSKIECRPSTSTDVDVEIFVASV